MNETKSELEELAELTNRFKQSVGDSWTRPFYLLWGIIWIMGYLRTYFIPQHAGNFWILLSVIGGVGTWLIIRHLSKSGPVIDTDLKTPFTFLGILWAFAISWAFMLRPEAGHVLNAYCASVAMFSFICLGIFFKNRSLLVTGTLIALFITIGYFALPATLFSFVDGDIRRRHHDHGRNHSIL